jgi:V/A-type H+-transporting ATPase subunit F
MKTIVLGDKDTILLFALEGVEGKVVESAQQAQEEIRRVRKARIYGLLVVTEQVVEWAGDAIAQLRFSRELPVVLDIPDANGHRKGVKQLPDYIREAVGIRV